MAIHEDWCQQNGWSQTLPLQAAILPCFPGSRLDLRWISLSGKLHMTGAHLESPMLDFLRESLDDEVGGLIGKWKKPGTHPIHQTGKLCAFQACYLHLTWVSSANLDFLLARPNRNSHIPRCPDSHNTWMMPWMVMQSSQAWSLAQVRQGHDHDQQHHEQPLRHCL